MVFIILGIVTLILAGNSKNYFFGLCWLFITVFLVCCGLFYPIHGYHEPIFQNAYELVPITYDISSNLEIYAIVDSDGSVTCKHMNKEDKNFAKNYTYEGDLQLKFEHEDEKPVLEIYLLKPKKSIFTFAISTQKTKYVFKVPESGTEILENEHVK